MIDQFLNKCLLKDCGMVKMEFYPILTSSESSRSYVGFICADSLFTILYMRIYREHLIFLKIEFHLNTHTH